MTALSIVRTVLSSLGLVLHSDFDVVRARLVEEHTLRLGREEDLLRLISRAGEVMLLGDPEDRMAVERDLSKAEMFLRTELYACGGTGALTRMIAKFSGRQRPPFYDPERVMKKPVERTDFSWWTEKLPSLEPLPTPLGECGSCASGAACPLHDAPAGGEQS